MKKGFTLVEMLVVVGILGILVSVLISGFAGGTDSARNAKCLTNMKNLASACHTYAMSSSHYPLAGSVEKMGITEKKIGKTVNKNYWELPGWLSWASMEAYKGGVSSHIANAGWFASAYNQDYNTREYCYTNGVIWRCLTGNRGVFQCPAHVRKFSKAPPAWSYVMNSYFGWDQTKGGMPKDTRYNGIEYGTLKRADRRLLFAEIPFMGVEVTPNTSESAGTECDCVLQYQAKDGNEVIGFNHSSGKTSKFAHVVFADGHAEKLTWPRDGLTEARLHDLTKWLCQGTDFSFNGKDYQEVR